ncbi:hypothetical protein NC653_038338 [Populus alba x Populus x berolinensis]|uniref:1-phosphatidylinositol 4-kinase n=1 Tax=Populus alba x Populus x berolinensis TaxID=444605 RepID=A0AAD6LHZ4_9ROSI|nr:hypothetical protein NC653_038338 [Populus alba x Populus x berolinensis]
MCPDLDHPVHIDVAVANLEGPLSGECCVNKRMERKPSGRGRVFVQTKTGIVLGMELDRSDNAHTVKRKLQLALNVPTEERSLIIGDKVLKNDLSAGRNDSPLLLTKNSMHRSSSTPCLSSSGKDLQQSDWSGPIEILGFSEHFAKVKQPTDEEPYAPNNPKGFVGKALGQPGLKRSVRVGETGFREVAAYLLDYNHFANVPSTALVKEAAAFGLCLAEIGEVMSREFRSHGEEPSELELICIKARSLLGEMKYLVDEVKLEDNEEFQFDIDCEELRLTSNIGDKLEMRPHCFMSKSKNVLNPLSKLEESAEEDEGEADIEEDEYAGPTEDKITNISRMSMLLKKISGGENSWRHEGEIRRSGYLAGSSSGNRSVNEQLPSSMSFVTLADLDEGEWVLFLENFKKLLYPAFINCESGSAGQRQRQRLGTSCQF